MTSILLLLLLPLLILCSGIVPFVEAFPSHRYRGKLLGRARININLGQDIPVRTESLQLSGNVRDFFTIACESSAALSTAIASYPKIKAILSIFVYQSPDSSGGASCSDELCHSAGARERYSAGLQ